MTSAKKTFKKIILDKVFKCKHCSFATKWKQTFKTHSYQHSKTLKFKCDECDFACIFPQSFKTHKLKHLGERPYECAKCGNRFFTDGALDSHIKVRHEKKRFKCNKCEYVAATSFLLKHHSSIHTGEKPHICKTCNASFRQKGHLNVHLQTHKGKLDYECENCHMTFATRSTLYHHKKTHLADKPFKCDICQKGFLQSNKLKYHLLTHEGKGRFKCKHCTFQTNYDNAIKYHKLVHTGKLPYKCEHCEFACRDKGNLKKHVVTHSDEKPFKCDFCEFASKWKESLKSHLSKLHSDESNKTNSKTERKIVDRSRAKRKRVVSNIDELKSIRKIAKTDKKSDKRTSKNSSLILSGKNVPSQRNSESDPDEPASANLTDGRVTRGNPKYDDKPGHSESDPDEPNDTLENTPYGSSKVDGFVRKSKEQITKSTISTKRNVLKSVQMTLSSMWSFKCKFNCGYLTRKSDELKEHENKCPQNCSQNSCKDDSSMERSRVKVENEISSINLNNSMDDFSNNGSELSDAVDHNRNFVCARKCSIIIKRLEELGNYHGCHYIRLKEPPYLYEVFKVNLNPVI